MSRSHTLRLLAFLLSLLSGATSLLAQVDSHADDIILSGTVSDENGEPLVSAVVIAQVDPPRCFTSPCFSVSELDGSFRIVCPRLSSDYSLLVFYLGVSHSVCKVSGAKSSRSHLTVPLHFQVGEVTVTASERRSVETTSVIGRDAMSHIQPSSFADLLELLPGGINSGSALGKSSLISLRDAGFVNSSGQTASPVEYSIASLGTQFAIDGAPVLTDANLQYSPLSGVQESDVSTNVAQKYSMTNRGVDMRTLSTDDVESVEIVRGIPSAEYGNLTSGLVNISKIRRRTPLRTRFKADGFSKLVSVGKGFALDSASRRVVNADAGFLDSQADPAVTYQNFKRINGSLRLTSKSGSLRSVSRLLSLSADFSSTIDNDKSDPNINHGQVDDFHSRQSNVAVTAGWQVKRVDRLFRSFDANAKVSLGHDVLRQRRSASPLGAFTVVPLSSADGESFAGVITSSYLAEFECDGRPFSAYAKGKAVFDLSRLSGENSSDQFQMVLGSDWSLVKNFGRGQSFDPARPLMVLEWDSRPRRYSSIPALQNLAFFAESQNVVSLPADVVCRFSAGVRLSMLPSLPSSYEMCGRLFADPRANLLISKSFGGMLLRLGGGWGRTSRMPTVNLLFPDRYYVNFVAMTHYDVSEPSDSKAVVCSYSKDVANRGLMPARSTKWEARLAVEFAGNVLDVNYFDERLSSGFRYLGTCEAFTYNRYDGTDFHSGMDYRSLPSVADRVLRVYPMPSNASRIDKHGVEFQMTSCPIRPLHTRVCANGAWFHSVFSCSRDQFLLPDGVVGGRAISDDYVGLFPQRDGREVDRVTSSVLFDTQVNEWGLVFTSSLQFAWYVRSRLLEKVAYPHSFMSSADGALHTYGEAAKSDYMLARLKRSVNANSLLPVEVPFQMFVNLKVTKSIAKVLSVSFFANKLFDYSPDYVSNGMTIRRHVSPYFGVEANLSL